MLFYENEPLRTQKLGVLASNQQNLTSVTLSLMISNIPLAEYSLFLRRTPPKAPIFHQPARALHFEIRRLIFKCYYRNARPHASQSHVD